MDKIAFRKFMANMAALATSKKFSEFDAGSDIQRGDIVVGLRAGENFQFDFPGLGIKDGNGNYMFQYDTVGASAVNFPLLVNALTGTSVVYGAGGTDTDIAIWIKPEGAAGVRIDDLNWPLSDGIPNSVMTTDGLGNLSFTSSAAVSGIIGTANQVLANGTSGSSQIGNVTLTTPQNIAPTSSPTFANLTLTNPLTLANGGTSKALVASNGGIVYTDTNSMEILPGTITARQMLQSGASATPAWSVATWPSTTVINQILYSSAANIVTGLPTANSAMFYTNSIGVPAFSASMMNGQIMIGATGVAPIPANLTAGTAINITNGANSITISSTGASGITGTANQVLANGTSGSIQTGNVTLTTPQDIATTSDVTFNSLTLTNPLAVGSGGTGLNTLNPNGIFYALDANTFAQITPDISTVVITDTSGIPTLTPSLTNGQLVIGGTGALPKPGNINAGSGILVTNGTNTITISQSTGGMTWTEVTGTTQLMVPDNGYIVNNAALVTLTLPTVIPQGSFIKIIGKGAGGWKIAQNAGQNLQNGNTSSTIGAGGSVASTNRYDSGEWVCTTADTTLTLLGAPQSSGLTIV